MRRQTTRSGGGGSSGGDGGGGGGGGTCNGGGTQKRVHTHDEQRRHGIVARERTVMCVHHSNKINTCVVKELMRFILFYVLKCILEKVVVALFIFLL